MNKTFRVVILTLTGVLLLSLTQRLRAQMTDLTGRQDLTVQEIEQALGDVTKRGDNSDHTRGIRPGFAFSLSFPPGSADIPTDATHNLDNLGKALQLGRLAAAGFRIVGHTDSTGHDCHNLLLSKHRAQSVKQYLVHTFEIAPQRLLTGGLGEEMPIANNETPEGRQRNRRVDIVNLGTP